MPEQKKPTIDPNFDPSMDKNLDVPTDVRELSRQEKNRRRLITYGAIAFAVIFIGILITISITRRDNQYHYIKLLSTYTANPNDISPGADIDAVEVRVLTAPFYAEKIVSDSFDEENTSNNYTDTERVLGPPATDSNAVDHYVSLGDQGGYIVLKVKPNLKDEKIKQLIIYEVTPNNLKEPYEVLVSHSKNGPWDYIGKKAGTTTIDLEKYFE